MTRHPHDPVALAYDIGVAITSSLDLNQVLRTVAEQAATAFGVWECNLFECRPENDSLLAVAVWAENMTPADEEFVGSVMRLHQRPAFRMLLAAARPHLDLIDDPALDPIERDAMAAWGELSNLWVPLLIQDEAVGGMVLIEKRELRTYSEQELELLELITRPVALAVQHARTNHRNEEERQRISSLLESTRAITSTMVVDDVLRLVAQHAAQAVGAPLCFMYEFDPLTDCLVTRSRFGSGSARCDVDVVGTCEPVGNYPDDRKMLESGRILEERLSDERVSRKVRAAMRRWGEKSVLNVPFGIQGETLGFLAIIETRYERRFSEDEVQLMRAFGEQAAVAIRNARLYSMSRRQNERLAALLDSSRAISSAIDLDEVLDIVARRAAEVLDCDECQIQEYDHEANTVTPVAFYQRVFDALNAESLGKVFDLADFPSDQEMIEKRAIKEERFSDHDLAPGTRAAMEKYNDRTYLNVPLMFNDEAIGVLVLIQTDQERHFTDDEREIAAAIAEQAAVAITNARLYRKVEEQAITDGLTGLYNHRYFYDRLQQELARAQRYRAPVSLLLLDLDDFKLFNDRYGHLAGDEALREVGRVLRSQVRRDVDLAARYGGEEFVVLLPNTPLAGAAVVGRRLQRALARARSATAEGSAADEAIGAIDVAERIRVAVAATAFATGVDGATEGITVCVGVASYPEMAASAQELVAYADAALYRAKRNGKNRVEVYEKS